MAVSAGCSIVSTRANGTMRNIATRRLACSLAYGGSANATSYCPGCSCSTNFIASTRWIVVRSSTFRVLMLARRALRASRCSSTNSAVAAPRDSASSPRAPEPAYRSTTRAPRTERCRMLNHASRTRFPVGRVLVPAGVLRRRFLNSPPMIWIIPEPSPASPMRNAERGTRNGRGSSFASRRAPRSSAFRTPHSALSSLRTSPTRREGREARLQRVPSLPLVQLQAKRHVERLAQPVLRNLIGPLEADRRQDPRAVVERKPQVVQAHAPRPDRARAPHPEHRRGIARPARLEVAHQALQFFADEPQGQLQVHALVRHQVVGAQKLAGDAQKCNTELLVAGAADGEPRRHHVPAVLLQGVAHAVQGGVQIEAHDAAPRTPPQVRTRLPADQERGPPEPLHQSRRDDADDAGVPVVGGQDQRPVFRAERDRKST